MYVQTSETKQNILHIQKYLAAITALIILTQIDFRFIMKDLKHILKIK